MDKAYVVGVDVGTQSVRAALVTTDGKIVKTTSCSIKTWNACPDFYEQSSEDIWQSCVKVIKAVTAGVKKEGICGIGFDATCSLVALDEHFQPVSLSTSGVADRNIILWMDHRAVEEAKLITQLSHPSLMNVGGIMSPEMQPPKLLWIKRNLPQQWSNVKHFFDLPDFLTLKATGCLHRSLCSLVCKFLYQPQEKIGWDASFWEKIELAEIISIDAKIGVHALSPGEKCGEGLTSESASSLLLLKNTPVSISVIDCYAGALGVLACSSSLKFSYPIEQRLAIISGTSACHVKVHEKPIMTAGVWGPYFSAMIPGMYCTEAGQSAAGVLLDHIIDTHPATCKMKQMCDKNRHITDLLNHEAKILSSDLKLPTVSHLTENMHIYPDFHGNRSPLADSSLTGMMAGLTLSLDKEDLIKKYIATVQALAYSTKHIINSLEESGHEIKVLILCGGLQKNELYVQMHADATGLPVIIPNEPEPVLLGSAILAATASGHYPSVTSAMSSMCGLGKLVEPVYFDQSYHKKKFEAFMKLLKCQTDINTLMCG